MRKYKLAVSNIAWDEDSNEQVLACMQELGFEGIEIAPTKIVNRDPYDHADEARNVLNAIEAKYGLEVCSMQSIWYGKDGNIFIPGERERLVDYTRNAMDYASMIGCRNLVFGCPRNRNMPEGASGSEAIPFFEACGSIANEYDVVLALEANPKIYGTNFLNTTAEAVSFLRSLPQRDGLGINLDFGTIIQNGESVEEVASFLPLVSHVHISEPNLAPIARRAEHRALRTILEDGGYDGFVSLEMKQTDIETVQESLRYFAEVFS